MLYNNYRPKKLKDVIGQDSTIKALQKRFKDKTIPHTLFLNGETGRGKTTLSRIIAKHLLCNSLDRDGEGCGICDICNAIDNEIKNNFFFELNASNLGINEIRELIKDSETKTFSQAKAKVFLIDELQEMSKTPAALKNLLKPLEKENKNVYFILGAMSTISIPDALKDRSVSYKLKSITIEDISKQLYDICGKESIKIDTEEKANVLITIADNSFGSLRKALSLLDRVVDSDLWTVQEVVKELDIISNMDIIQSINCLFSGDKNAFDIQYNEELIKKLRFMLGNVYKSLSGLFIPSWQANQLKGINKNISLYSIEYALNKLFELNKYPYINQEIIDYILIDIFNNNKKEVIPKRRGE